MSAEGIDTSRVIAELKGAAGAHSLPSEEQRRELEWLCRKIQVARRVDARYRSGWKKEAGAPTLDKGAWVDLVGVLVDWSRMPAESEDHRGLALKLLNAAFAAVDLAAAAGVDGSAELAEVCRGRLSQIEAGIGA